MTRWTAAEIPTLTGEVALVTGANNGLGYETALQLARHGAHVVLACRNAERAEEAAATIRVQVADGGTVEVALLDLASLGSVARFAAAFIARHDRLDLLINNAGIMGGSYTTSVDGIELHFATNYLGHFALTGRLLPLLLKSQRARVVTLSSLNHRVGDPRGAPQSSEKGYSNWRAYGSSKLANLVFAYELQRRATAAGATLQSMAAHPGYAMTRMNAPKPGNLVQEYMGHVQRRLLAQSAAQGALPTLYAATAPEVKGGAYYGPDGVGEMRGYPAEARSSRTARDPRVARRLWATSEGMSGVGYGPLDAVKESTGDGIP